MRWGTPNRAAKARSFVRQRHSRAVTNEYKPKTMVAAHMRRVELRSACLRIIAPPNKPRTYKPPTAKRACLSQRHAVSKTHNDPKATHSKFSRGKAVAAKLRATKKVRVARET